MPTTSASCNPGFVSRTRTCFYASAAVNWFENKVNQFTAAHTPYQTRAAQSCPRWWQFKINLRGIVVLSDSRCLINDVHLIVLQDVADVFSIFHDGTIVGYSGDREILTLEIECQYLAVRISPDFERFYVELSIVEEISLFPWMNPFDLKQEHFVELKEVFQAKLELLSAEVAGDFVKVSCNQYDLSFKFCGGTLHLRCFDIKVYDQEKREITIEELDAICNAYWKELLR